MTKNIDKSNEKELLQKKEVEKQKEDLHNKDKFVPEKDATYYKELFLRVSADFQNFKNRAAKERSTWIQDAQAVILLEVLPLLDDLNLAICACCKDNCNTEEHDWLKGLKIIQKKISKSLKVLGIEEIDCSAEFNPRFHEALMQVDSSEHKSGQIVSVLNKGYLFKGEVLRHAKVSVAK